MDTSNDSQDGPEVWSILTASLDTYREEHMGRFAPPESEPEIHLRRALDAIESFVLDIVTTGTIASELEAALEHYNPGDKVETKVTELLSYNLTHDRIEFEVASDVCWRLRGLKKRVGIIAVAFLFLVRANPSATAVKYLRQATTLYLGGYDPEVFIMCGAVIDAAMGSRLPDHLLAAAGWRPAYRRTGVFSLGQRLAFEEQHPFLSDHRRQELRDLVNWRNDAIHVQPDLSPDPAKAVLSTALLLPDILPRDAL